MVPTPHRIESHDFQPRFLPRPIILQLVSQSRKNYPGNAEAKQDPDQLFGISSSFTKAMAVTGSQPTFISPEKANLLQSLNINACDDPRTHYHHLKCGHNVTTSTTFPSNNEQKSQCASNCKGSNGLQGSTIRAFICPACIETLLRRNYTKIWKEYRANGFHPPSDPATNIGIWVCVSVRYLARFGMRIMQGTTGLFLLGNENEYKTVEFVPDVVKRMYGMWDFRERERRLRSRSRSPVRYGRNMEEDTRAMRKYRDRSPLRKRDNLVVQDLVEHFGNARIGMVRDAEVDGLLQGMEAMETGRRV